VSSSALLEIAGAAGLALLAASVAAIAVPLLAAIWSGIVEEIPELPFVGLDAVEADAVTVLKLEGYLRADWQWPDANADDATRATREDELTAAHNAWRCDAERLPPSSHEIWP
jgi:hypothetical protein